MRRSHVGRPEPRPAARLWRRIVLALTAAPAAIALLVAATPASPTPTPSPSDSPTPAARGTLQVVKTDQSGAPIVIPGARFRVHQGSAQGDVVATITTNNTGKATAMDLVAPSAYCLEEVAAPPGFQVAPTYTPSACRIVQPGQTTVISAADPPAAASTPTPSATPTPTPTPTVTGELQITKVDPNNQVVTAPGFTFNVHVGSAKGQVIATIATDGSGIAVAGALNPATYCVEEVSAPDGWQVQPTYSPQSSCVAVAPDPTQGRNPTTVTVTDPPAPTPTPAEVAGAGPSASPSAHPNATSKPATATGLPMAALSKGLIGFGALLLVAGAVMIALAIRRRRMPPPSEPPAPADYWYDSTIS